MNPFKDRRLAKAIRLPARRSHVRMTVNDILFLPLLPPFGLGLM
jgi:hypothetical protein